MTRTLDRVYDSLTPEARFRAAVEAFGRKDLAEVDRLNDTAGYRSKIHLQEPAYFGRLQELNELAMWVSLHVRDFHEGFLALALSESWDDEECPRQLTEDEVDDLFIRMRASLRGLKAGWETFCAEVGVRPADVECMGLRRPVFGTFGTLGTVDDDGIAASEDYRDLMLDFLRHRWKSRLTSVGAFMNRGAN